MKGTNQMRNAFLLIQNFY